MAFWAPLGAHGNPITNRKLKKKWVPLLPKSERIIKNFLVFSICI
jgi:hypothetical protein